MNDTNIKSIVFDADGTLLTVENPYLVIAKALDCRDIVKEWVLEYLSHKISYQDLMDRETKLFVEQYIKIYGRHPRIGDFEKFLPLPEIKPDGEKIVDYLLDNNKHVYVLSSGFLYLVDDLVKLKIKLRDIHANRFLYDTSGEFVMIKIDVSGDKMDGYDAILTSDHLDIQETAYVGDNAFDLDVIKYVLDKQGHVFFLLNPEAEFKVDHLPQEQNLIVINNLEEIKNFI